MNNNNQQETSFEKRAEALVSLMTTEEKISQMLHYTPAIPRLDIPYYNWWNEGLHGVARAGVATVFPQAIGLAATFNQELIHKVATVISDEGRAKYHEFIRQDDREIYKGLTYWSPNVNIFRDPRWGRGQETYGEDPYLSGQLGVSFIKGLQGEDPRYLKIAACAKHFAVHSGPEGERHEFNAEPSLKDLYETYLPAFESCVKDGEVEAVMGAYNALYGIPCCGSKFLLQDILRDRWGFKGHVVSDCGAICDFHQFHKITSDKIESSVMAIEAGSDLNCGDTYAALVYAVEKGLVSEEAIHQAVVRLYTTKFKLGMFEKEEEVPFSKIPYEINDCEEHKSLSREAARQSYVLLKNDGILPLSTERYKKIAVIGPNAHNSNMLRGNYCGTFSEYYTPYMGIKKYIDEDKENNNRIFYTQGCDYITDEAHGISEAVSIAELCDLVIVCVGLNADIEGEEGDAGQEGIIGDKKSLVLPGKQMTLLERVLKSGTPTIVVNYSGSPMDLCFVDEHACAVIQGWYPGAQGGIALADLIFGKSDFSGKLPVTFVRKTEDLPDFRDYNMKGRTYRYLEKAPLYPFGFGLSYNQYDYSNLIVEGNRISISVKNNGNMQGREVVQVYVKHFGEAFQMPNYQLVGFKSLDLQPGEERNCSFEMKQKQLDVINMDGERIKPSGEIKVYVGGQCPDSKSEALKTSKNMVESLVYPF